MKLFKTCSMEFITLLGKENIEESILIYSTKVKIKETKHDCLSHHPPHTFTHTSHALLLKLAITQEMSYMTPKIFRSPVKSLKVPKLITIA